jgi:hypothetical protein
MTGITNDFQRDLTYCYGSSIRHAFELRKVVLCLPELLSAMRYSRCAELCREVI